LGETGQALVNRLVVCVSRACQGEEMESDQPDASSCPADELVLLGLCLSVDEKVAYDNTVSFFLFMDDLVQETVCCILLH
jgi:hypothetical protein